MDRKSGNLSQNTLRLVEDAELSQHGSPVVIDSFPCQTIIGIERVHTTERELDSSPRCRKTTPPSKVRTPNDDFDENGIIGDVLPLYLDF